MEPGSQTGITDTGARPAGQNPGSKATSTSGRPAEDAEEQSLLARITAPFKELAMRGTVYTSFIFAKQPKRIRQVRTGTMYVQCTAWHPYISALSGGVYQAGL